MWEHKLNMEFPINIPKVGYSQQDWWIYCFDIKKRAFTGTDGDDGSPWKIHVQREYHFFSLYNSSEWS